MNKTELCEKLAKKTGLTKAQATEAVNAIFHTTPGKGIIAVELDAGRSVTIPGFGIFGTSRRKEREGAQPPRPASPSRSPPARYPPSKRARG